MFILVADGTEWWGSHIGILLTVASQTALVNHSMHHSVTNSETSRVALATLEACVSLVAQMRETVVKPMPQPIAVLASRLLRDRVTSQPNPPSGL